MQINSRFLISIVILLACFLLLLIPFHVLNHQALAATADDYFIYSKFGPPGVGDIVVAVDVITEPPPPPEEIIASLQSLSVKVVPNPCGGCVHRIRFYAQAAMPVEQIKVGICDLTGRSVYESEWSENGFARHVDNLQGRS